nr:sulfotransferase [uncultured Desulfobacter sp.]
MEKNSINPVFIFSLPRSGSTLLQRIVSQHPGISTSSEPWILLPFFYMLKPEGVYSEYSHITMHRAVEDFIKTMKHGKDEYLHLLHEHIIKTYRAASDADSFYFLDKTPRYHLIVDDIFQMFPQAKFIFLWRHPLAVVTSIVETFIKGRWRLSSNKIDLFQGLSNLIAAYEKHRHRAVSINYEHIISNPEKSLAVIFDYLDLEYDNAFHDKIGLSNQLTGKMGDPTGVKAYKNISREPLEKWKKTVFNVHRKAWCKRYIEWIGEQRLSVMGYSKDSILNDLEEISLSRKSIIHDYYDAGRDAMYCLFDIVILKQKVKLLSNRHKIYRYG